MPRTARIIAPDCLYHIICRGNNKQAVFFESVDFQQYLFLLAKYKAEHPFFLYHYVLMNNHVHLLLEPSTSDVLSRFMLKLNLAYAHYFQKKYGGVGHLWQGRYKSILVAKDSYCLSCAAYIELNPVAAGIVQDPEAYPWSSYHHSAFGTHNPLVHPNPFFGGLGNTVEEQRDAYRAFVKEVWQRKNHEEEEMDSIRYFGSPEFVQRMEHTIGVPNKSQRGRPRKT